MAGVLMVIPPDNCLRESSKLRFAPISTWETNLSAISVDFCLKILSHLRFSRLSQMRV